MHYDRRRYARRRIQIEVDVGEGYVSRLDSGIDALQSVSAWSRHLIGHVIPRVVLLWEV